MTSICSFTPPIVSFLYAIIPSSHFLISLMLKKVPNHKGISLQNCFMVNSFLCMALIFLVQSRLMMEVNYMLSYGAAEPSLSLLQRYNILDMLLPFHVCHIVPSHFGLM